MNLISSLFILHKHKHLCLCNTNPKTPSFRATTIEDNDDPMLMNPNKDPLVEPEVDQITTLGSCFTNSSEYSPSISTESDSSAVETIVRGAASEQRLFYEPDSTSSIVDIQGGSSDIGGGGGGLVYEESVAVVVETEDPYGDFKRSMEEMMQIHALNDWDCLVELLRWYLRMNEEDNHEFIVGAFIDLLAEVSGGGDGGDGGGDGGVLCVDHQSTTSLTSAASSFSSPISSPNGN